MMRLCMVEKTQQTGAALIISLIMLVILTLLSLTAMRNIQIEERMAGNYRDRSLSFQGAEAGLRDSEAYLQSANLPPFDGSEAGLMNLVPGSGSTAYWTNFDWANNSQQAITSLAHIKEQPRFVIEELPAIPAATESQKFGALREQNLYKITSRSTGSSGTAVVILQSTVQR